MSLLNRILDFVKNWTLPVAITIGTAAYLLFHLTPSLDAAGDVFYRVFNVVLPVGLFITLFISYCKIDFRQIRIARWHLAVLGAQVLLIGLTTLLALGLEGSHPQAKLVCEALLTCFIAPCATAAPIVTYKIGGDLNSVTTFMLISCLLASFAIPALFPLLEPHAHLSFLSTFGTIIYKISLITVLSMFAAWLVRHAAPTFHAAVLRQRNLAYYSWSFCLSITSGITVRNLVGCLSQPHMLMVIALLSLAVCIFQFALGRLIGRRFGMTVTAGQAMFQKNTGLAIWVANMYLSPISTVGAGSYVVWQNLINSYELWRSRKDGTDS
ncbi:MAG: transporter [Alloprevotella sp.]|nr:transporter [Alloprevotella sp.]